ncbi:MAG: transposase [Deltaproteobacteria bacterium]|nr:transposase [Deltaproteobacteria bacterium]
MPTALSEDLRNRVVRAYLAGGVRVDELAERFSIGSATVKRWIRLYRLTGSTARPPAKPTRTPVITEAHTPLLHRLVEDHPDATLPELATLFAEMSGLTVGRFTMGRALRRAGITRKKSLSSPSKGTRRASRIVGTSGSR